MNIKLIGNTRTIIENPNSPFGYFAWPTATRLQNGKIAVVASGFRRRHVCPFGKTVISYSEDNGETYSLPAPVIDTCLDDRDGGILAFGKSGVIVTGYNNRMDSQRDQAGYKFFAYDDVDIKYMDFVSKEKENKYIGSIYRVSNDCGVTFGEIRKSPLYAPHGPIELKDGTILWIGCPFTNGDIVHKSEKEIQIYSLNPETGETEFLGDIEPITVDGKPHLSCEPHAIELDDGSILVHIRVQDIQTPPDPTHKLTIFQAVSHDKGRTWTKPVQIIGDTDGGPAHLMKHSSGALICSYGFRGIPLGEKPFGVRVMLSFDNGKTWDINHDIYTNNASYDLGYPSTVELDDGTLATIFYAHKEREINATLGFDPIRDTTDFAVIMQQKWSFEK